MERDRQTGRLEKKRQRWKERNFEKLDQERKRDGENVKRYFLTQIIPFTFKR